MAERKHRRVVQQPDHRANRTILVRTLILLAVFGVAVFIPLFVRLWQIQIRDYDRFQELAVEQQTGDSVVAAQRGVIYDRNGEVLAMSATVYNIQLSPKEILACQEAYADDVKNGKELDYPEPTDEFIASNLAQILGLEEEDILKRLEKTYSMYEIIAQRVDEDTRNEVLAFTTENHITGIFTPPTTMRIYPKGSLAAQVIGWVNPNTENTGAYGIEAQYESVLAGETGRIVTAKNADGTQMLYQYENYYDGMDGCDLELTLDSKIQSFCENILAKGIEQFEVQDGGFCIAMDPNTGEILAWANSPTFDPNDPWAVSDPVLLQYLADIESGEYTKEEAYQKALAEGATTEEARDTAISAAESEVLYKQWANRSISSTYEPGSTFKSIVLAAALEEGVVSESSTFYCSGVAQVDGWSGAPIQCSDRDGHGTQTLAKAVANSCNPAFIAIGQALGAEKFYNYLEDFGFLEKTGIDVLGESNINPVSAGLIWDRDKFTNVDLAVASFGQRFQVTPLQLITAAAAVINGGHLMQPYVVQALTDQDGNVVEQTEPTEVRQVVSESTSALVREMLYGVVNGGTGKNANVEGYRIGGKTGTSEKRDEDTGDLIVSFLGVAPADDPQIVVLIAFDSPTPVVPGSNYTSHGFYISGGNMGALSAGPLIADILDYLGVEKVYSDNAYADVVVPQTVGLSQADAIKLLQSKGLGYRVVGDGAAVTDQLPAQGVSIPGKSEVVLYLGAEKPTEQVSVPDLTRMTASAAEKALTDLGLYMRPVGVTDYSDTTIATEQSIAAGTLVDPGTVVEVHFMDTAVQDYAANGNISNIH